MTTMIAMQVPQAGGRLERVERAIPEPGAKEVLIAVHACGVCHSDSVTVEGLMPGIAYPRVPGHEVPELVRRQLPVRPRVVGQLGQRYRAAQALVDARAPGQQRVGPRPAGRVPLPEHLAARRAQAERPVHRAPHRRPHGQRVPLVAGHQVLVPGADGDVRRVMAFGGRIGDPP